MCMLSSIALTGVTPVIAVEIAALKLLKVRSSFVFFRCGLGRPESVTIHASCMHHAAVAAALTLCAATHGWYTIDKALK